MSVDEHFDGVRRDSEEAVRERSSREWDEEESEASLHDCHLSPNDSCTICQNNNEKHNASTKAGTETV